MLISMAHIVRKKHEDTLKPGSSCIITFVYWMEFQEFGVHLDLTKRLRETTDMSVWQKICTDGLKRVMYKE